MPVIVGSVKQATKSQVSGTTRPYEESVGTILLDRLSTEHIYLGDSLAVNFLPIAEAQFDSMGDELCTAQFASRKLRTSRRFVRYQAKRSNACYLKQGALFYNLKRNRGYITGFILCGFAFCVAKVARRLNDVL